MTNPWPAEWLWLLALVPLVPLYRRGLRFAWRLVSRLHIRKLLSIAAGVDVHVTDLLGTGTRTDALELIHNKVREEMYLMAWRLLQHAERAGDASTFAELHAFLDEHGTRPPGEFHGFLVKPTSLLAVRWPAGVRAHNARTRRLRCHWHWASDWTRYRRYGALTPRL
jgi:hypothetical protein